MLNQRGNFTYEERAELIRKYIDYFVLKALIVFKLIENLLEKNGLDF
ncbi:hypothetical protein [Lacihabitans sp. LS3-19]|nr:hypothetical protein [Lacihabitans sp. LS3-19]